MPVLLEDIDPAFALATLPNDIVSLDEGIADPSILKAVFLAGAGGSGKSKVAGDMFAGQGLKVINQDRHLERLLAASDIPLSKVGMHYGLQKKAQGLKNAEVRQYGLRRLGMVIDSTGWDAPRIVEPLKKLRSLGYDCYMVFVTTTLETALRRNSSRDRVVPASFVTQAHTGAHANLAEFKKAFGDKNVFVINNDTEFTDATWDRIVAPALRKLGRSILKLPVKNPVGKAWLQRKTADSKDTVDVAEWPKPVKPEEPKALPKLPPSGPKNWRPIRLTEGLGTAPGKLKKKEKLGTYDDCTVYLVSGSEVRQAGFVDFVGGGHHLAYPEQIPKGEIWVEEMKAWLDTATFMVHELTEYTRMKYAKEKYDPAHGHSNDAEALVRAVLKRGGVDEATGDQLQELLRGTKVVGSDGLPLLMYHGTSTDFTKLQIVQKKGALMQDGPGLYFTNHTGEASGYGALAGGRVIPVYLVLKNPVTPSTKILRSTVESLIRSAPDYEDRLVDWDDNPKTAFKTAVDAMLRSDGPIDTCLSIWGDFYRDHPLDYLKQMLRVGFDGMLMKMQDDVVRAVVFSPKSVVSALTKAVLG